MSAIRWHVTARNLHAVYDLGDVTAATQEEAVQLGIRKARPGALVGLVVRAKPLLGVNAQTWMGRDRTESRE